MAAGEPGASKRRVDSSMDEYSKFSGDWIQVFASEDGAEISIEDGVHTRIEGNRFEVRDKDGSLQIKGNFKLYENQSENAIDWIDTYGPDSGKTFLAIYEISDNELSFCAADEHMPRPQALNPGKGYTIRKFVKRQKHG